MATSAASATPAPAELITLFSAVEAKFAGTSLGSTRWYILVLAAIVGGGEPEAAASLYLHVATPLASGAPRQALVRRLRETLVKSVSIYGVCKPIEAIVAINAVEQEADKDHSFSRHAWTSGPDNHRRGMDWLAKVYGRNLDATMDLFKDHLDFGWISQDVTYGLYLADRQVLDDVDTELVVLAGIMIQNLPKETWWHIRGCRRVGVGKEDMQVVWDCVQLVARYLGLTLSRVPAPEQVEADV